ncbi:MAG: hypothetical protein A2Y23_11615 [Clostridiales bacterium GWB2_37_7]|nr:MAG: hypothetical protein A2Y23_11615 [Clostridiales bacterium GWB2_37_7]
MKRVQKLILILGLILYLQSFIWFSKVNILLMYIGGILVSFSLLVIGVKLLKTKKIAGILIIVATIFILITLIFTGVSLFIFDKI